MSESLKEFQQKVDTRKFAIDNSWKVSSTDDIEQYTFSNNVENLGDCGKELPWGILEENISAANECKFFDGYFPLKSDRKILGKWIILLKRITRRLLKIFMGWYIFPHYQKMSHFNGKIVNAVALERDILSVIDQRITAQGQELHEKIDYFLGREKEFHQDMEELRREKEELRQENEKLILAIQTIQKQVEILSDEKQKLGVAIENLTSGNEQLYAKIKKLENLPTDDDEFYHCFEEKFRGSQELIRERQEVYVPIIQKYIKDWSKARFIDVGSGRGEWLDILRENGAQDYIGIDLNARQNAICEEKGHKVLEVDCIKYLADCTANSVDIITGFQIIEHLCMEDLLELLRQSYRVLKPGGLILFETQNPKNLIVGANTFYFDPSHKRPLNPEMVIFFAEWCGYTQVRYIDANPCGNWAGITFKSSNEEINEIIRQFNDVNYKLYGPQDYAVIGVKGERNE